MTYLLMASLALQMVRVEPHGLGAYGIGSGGKKLTLERLTEKRVEDWGNQHFRPTFALPPPADPRADVAQAPAHDELGSAVFARYDGRGVLAVYDRPMKTPAIDIYDEHHRYTVLYQVVRAIPGKPGPTGRPDWVLDLEGLYPGILEMHDLHLAGDALYVGIGINGYAKVLDGRTAYVACIEVPAGRLRWRTGPLVSNGPLLPLGDHLVTGYGFTAEPDFLYVLDRHTGATVAKVPVPNAMEDLAEKEGTLYVKTYDRYMTYAIGPR